MRLLKAADASKSGLKMTITISEEAQRVSVISFFW